MKKTYTVTSNIIITIVIFIILGIGANIFISNSVWIYLSIFAILSLLRYKDFMIQIRDNQIILFSLLKKKTISIDTIKKIVVNDYVIPIPLLGSRRYLHIILNDCEYSFNVCELENDNFYKIVSSIANNNQIEFIKKG